MKHIMEAISDHIDEEIEDARSYARMAANQKRTNPEAYQTFLKLSKEEINHAQMLRDLAESMIAKNPNDKSIPDMYTIYNYLKGKQNEKINEVKVMQAMM